MSLWECMGGVCVVCVGVCERGPPVQLEISQVNSLQIKRYDLFMPLAAIKGQA